MDASLIMNMCVSENVINMTICLNMFLCSKCTSKRSRL